MQYITIKRFKRDNIRGYFNIPYGTTIEEYNGLLYYQGKNICGDHSAVMREFFARNDDGLGLERGKLSQSIIKTLQIRPDETKEDWNKRWDIVRKDFVCMRYNKYSNKDDNDFLWSIEFFNAPIEDLKYIANLVGARKEKDK